MEHINTEMIFRKYTKYIKSEKRDFNREFNPYKKEVGNKSFRLAV